MVWLDLEPPVNFESSHWQKDSSKVIEFQMTLIHTFQDTSAWRGGPQDSLRQNEEQNNLQQLIFRRQALRSEISLLRSLLLWASLNQSFISPLYELFSEFTCPTLGHPKWFWRKVNCIRKRIKDASCTAKAKRFEVTRLHTRAHVHRSFYAHLHARTLRARMVTCRLGIARASRHARA